MPCKFTVHSFNLNIKFICFKSGISFIPLSQTNQRKTDGKKGKKREKGGPHAERKRFVRILLTNIV